MNIGCTVIASVLLVTTIIGAVRPRTVMVHLDTSIGDVSAKFYDIENSFDATKLASIKGTLMDLQIRGLELQESTLRTSGSPLKELCAFFRGHSLSIIKCIQGVHILDAEIEILKAQEDRRRVKAGERLERRIMRRVNEAE
ncbi:hypothetical protein C0991_002344 [Blastosporella zonata]|nr:hypothetical protein C0991_002344 [Blastosporella zonata]